MTYKELLELESSFDSCFHQLIYEMKVSGMGREEFALISTLYGTLSAQIGGNLDQLFLDEQPSKD